MKSIIHFILTSLVAWPHTWGVYSSVSVKNVVLRSGLNFPWCSFILFPCIQSLVTREDQNLPLRFSPWVCWRLSWGHSWVFSSSNWTKKVTSATLTSLALETILITTPWTRYSILMPFLFWDTHNCSQYI